MHLVVVAAIKSLEDPAPVRRRYPRAIICDTQGPALSRGGQRYNNATARVSIPDGVVSKVADDRTQRVKFDGFIETSRSVERQVDSLCDRCRRDCCELIPDNRHNVTQRHFVRSVDI